MTRTRLIRVLVVTAGLVLSAVVLGFIVFASVATRGVSDDQARADGIVVLTGGGARIAEAARLLEQGRGRRLLISGVNRKTGRDALKRLTGLPEATFTCCVDVGYAALDTTGNADETRAWVQTHAFGSLLVVTATYHMPRALAELGHALPGIALMPHPVLPRDLNTSGWWLYPSTARLLAAEYVKLLSSLARLAAQSMVWSKGAAGVREAGAVAGALAARLPARRRYG